MEHSLERPFKPSGGRLKFRQFNRADPLHSLRVISHKNSCPGIKVKRRDMEFDAVFPITSRDFCTGHGHLVDGEGCAAGRLPFSVSTA